MAVYGIDTTPGQVPWTGYSNTLGSGPANADATAGFVSRNGFGQFDKQLARIFQQGEAGKRMKALWIALTGAAAGGTATATTKWVKGTDADTYFSPRAIETITQVNRVTTAADVTAFTALLNRVVYPSTYVADLSGNGGGGKGAY